RHWKNPSTGPVVGTILARYLCPDVGIPTLGHSWANTVHILSKLVLTNWYWFNASPVSTRRYWRDDINPLPDQYCIHLHNFQKMISTVMTLARCWHSRRKSVYERFLEILIHKPAGFKFFSTAPTLG
ncbi:hypothetical protein TSAR_012195, partial [Trichomalopsis sarcophagae]